MSHIVNTLNKRQETDVRRSKGVCDVFGQTLSQAASHHVTLSNMKAVYLINFDSSDLILSTTRVNIWLINRRYKTSRTQTTRNLNGPVL
jgi:hypothetical protein